MNIDITPIEKLFVDNLQLLYSCNVTRNDAETRRDPAALQQHFDRLASVYGPDSVICSDIRAEMQMPRSPFQLQTARETDLLNRLYKKATTGFSILGRTRSCRSAPIVAVLPRGHLHAMVCYPKIISRPIIFIDQGVFTTLNQVTKIFVAIIHHLSDRNPLDPIWRNGDALAALITDDLVDRYTDILICHTLLKMPRLSMLKRVDSDKAGFVALILHLMELFIFCHEWGHFELGHLDSKPSTEDMPVRPVGSIVNSCEIDFGWDREFQADDIALRAVIAAANGRPGVEQKNIYTTWWALLVFVIMEQITMLTELVQFKKLQEGYTTTHPSSVERRNRLVSTFVNEITPEREREYCGDALGNLVEGSNLIFTHLFHRAAKRISTVDLATYAARRIMYYDENDARHLDASLRQSANH